MPLYDITLPLRVGMLTYPGDPPFTMEQVAYLSRGDRFNLSRITLATHTGTHCDPPLHYLDGRAAIDEIPLEVLVGPGTILDMRGRPKIDRAALESSDLEEHTRVFFKTDNGPKLLAGIYSSDYVALTEDAAVYLVDRGIQLVGIDYLAIEAFANPLAPVHRTLLGAGALIVEGLVLVDVPAGPCKIYCLPLKIAGGDGAPARVLVETD
ncbi:MAG: cyclase family protein [Desulfomonile tiedjei]|nr:cyclase family protein [Desulfomonile tiedjei]